jgi:hypothetical protein
MDITRQLRESCFCEGRGCELCRAADEIERLRAELSDAYAEVRKQVAVSKVVFDRALVNRAKASLATPSEEK